MLLALLLSFPDALLNRPYVPEVRTERASARCPSPAIAIRLAGGALPPGMTLTGRGELEGTPTKPGQYSFHIEVFDGCLRRIEERHLRVIHAPILIAEAAVREFRCVHGAPPFSAGIVRVSGSAPGRAYNADVLDGNWLRTAMREGELPSAASAFESDALQLTIDPGNLPPGDYSARLRVSAWQGANAPELLFRLHVDSPQSVFAPIPLPMATATALPPIDLPNVQIVLPPPLIIPEPPAPQRPYMQPKPGSAGKGSRIQSNGRSRVLPFPKVTIPRKPAATGTAPERTKPAAMPPPEPAAPHAKPKAAH
ncbi:MAG: putative Ig domain-containing protein [Acidobacteria bacterium]|nr:putative Ig domain-containing protein [Acidobacteriota bacterium]